ncbi:Papain family cysteine protease [uncultured archaeon]|nr:Papain family cysteine protease [uncultured archaeon]
MPKETFPFKFGWLPDLPDARDYTKETAEIKSLLKKPSSVPTKVDLRAYCTPIYNQGNIGSCTANAAAGMVEYYRKKAYGKDGSVSRLFIYKATRDLMQAKGDSGAYIRTAMGALALIGAPPEKYWQYDELGLDAAPPAFCYSFAQNYQAIVYFRADEKSVGMPSKTKDEVLCQIKETLAQGIPLMFGFRVYDSIKAAKDGKIPFPERGEAVLGGHAVLAVGYDDDLKIGKCTGAFIIRNSWGEEWGDKGYGYLPYEYVLGGLAEDWWALVKADWIGVEAFGV